MLVRDLLPWRLNIGAWSCLNTTLGSLGYRCVFVFIGTEEKIQLCPTDMGIIPLKSVSIRLQSY